jgi:hypothetical protein
MHPLYLLCLLLDRPDEEGEEGLREPPEGGEALIYPAMVRAKVGRSARSGDLSDGFYGYAMIMIFRPRITLGLILPQQMTPPLPGRHFTECREGLRLR